MPNVPAGESPEQVDAVVVGAGLAGLAIAIGLARTGIRVASIDAVDTRTVASRREDLRTAALFAPSVEFLTGIGVWARVEAKAAPLRALRIVERGSGPLGRGATMRMRASDIGSEALAANVPNPALLDALHAVAGECDSLSVIQPARIRSLVRRDDKAVVWLDDGRILESLLVIAADGGDSPTRESVGLRTVKRDRGYAALAFHAELERDAGGLCTELHGPSGLLTVIPMLKRQVAGIWVLPAGEAARRAGGGVESFVQGVNQAAGRTIGVLRVVRGPETFRIRTRIARSLTARRLLLAGEAAHVLPPVGAQGLNLSFGDAREIVSLVTNAVQNNQDIGGKPLLDRYRARRRVEILARAAAVEGYWSGMGVRLGPLAGIRRAAIGSIGQAPFVRSAIARAAFAGRGLRPCAARYQG